MNGTWEPRWDTSPIPTREQKNRAHFAKKEQQRQLRQDLRGTPEDQRINKLIWRWITVVVLGIGGAIYLLPAWVLGVSILVIVGLVAMVAITTGVAQGRGQ